MKKPFATFFSAALRRNHEVAIMYFGRTSEFLMTTSERMAITTGAYTLGQLLNSLRKRSDRWADELDERHVICTVNGENAGLSDTLASGAEIGIYSKKSVFEP